MPIGDYIFIFNDSTEVKLIGMSALGLNTKEFGYGMLTSILPVGLDTLGSVRFKLFLLSLSSWSESKYALLYGLINFILFILFLLRFCLASIFLWYNDLKPYFAAPFPGTFSTY